MSCSEVMLEAGYFELGELEIQFVDSVIANIASDDALNSVIEN